MKSSTRDQPNLVREIHHHRQFRHPHIARLYEIIVTETLVWLVLEYCPGDELYAYLIKNGRLKQDQVKKIFSELCGAVAYTHSKNCTHRDLKLENTLLDRRNSVKLCDFGFTREYESRNLLETVCGTTCYMAPEMIQRKKYSGEAVDVWSLGVIFYTLLYGEMPFEEETEVETSIKVVNEEPAYPNSSSVPPAAVELAKWLLSKNAKLRPTLQQILNHPYLEEYSSIQRAILARNEPKLFSSKPEKKVLRNLKSANIDLGSLADSVISQNCDPLAGLWALALEKQLKKESKRSGRTSLNIAKHGLSRKESDGKSSAPKITITTNGLKSESPRSQRSQRSPLSPFARISSSFRSSTEADRPNLDHRDSTNSTSIPTSNSLLQAPPNGLPNSSPISPAITSVSTDADNVSSTPITPATRMIQSVPDILTLANVQPSPTSVDIQSHPSQPPPPIPPEVNTPSLKSTRSSLLARTKTLATTKTKEFKNSLKTTMMKLVFVDRLRRRKSSPKLESSDASTSVDITQLEPSNVMPRQQSEPSPRKNARPISQISQFSAFSQISQYSTNSSAPSQLSQERLAQNANGTSRRPRYGRRSTSSSISSLISRHRKTSSKASSTSSASLRSTPHSPRRVASPVPGSSLRPSHSPFPSRRQARSRFHETAVFGSHSGRSRPLRRKSPFSRTSFGRNSTPADQRLSSKIVAEEGEDEATYEDMEFDDDR